MRCQEGESGGAKVFSRSRVQTLYLEKKLRKCRSSCKWNTRTRCPCRFSRTSARFCSLRVEKKNPHLNVLLINKLKTLARLEKTAGQSTQSLRSTHICAETIKFSQNLFCASVKRTTKSSKMFCCRVYPPANASQHKAH